MSQMVVNPGAGHTFTLVSRVTQMVTRTKKVRATEQVQVEVEVVEMEEDEDQAQPESANPLTDHTRDRSRQTFLITKSRHEPPSGSPPTAFQLVQVVQA